ncbi:hypothetical protein QAD02_020746 [Eretmocerus hayati]|uniref:Uncharacterized protein n=1 Tax=Eretmocerus hayati TaxID=131215 RepID=A0ACC2PNB5_9HYME|nr:hypothetical protein QAD02_020746 [Eretmocerus hayati]
MVRREYQIEHRPDDRPVPQDIRNEAREIQLDTLPPISKAKYLKRYDDYMTWCKGQKTHPLSEKSLLVYLRKLNVVDENAASTIRSVHSMIKACAKAYHNFDIGIFSNVNSYLSNLSRCHEPKKAYILSTEQMQTFVMTAPDIEYFLIKVILIIGVIGCCRKSELVYLMMKYVTLTDNAPVIRHYFEARKLINNKRIFLTFRHGSFINEAAGERTIASVPRKVAEYLGLPEPHRYTSHSIRRSSATAYAGTGCIDIELMRHGRWRNIKCASGYVEDTKYSKRKIAHLISNAILIPQQQTSIVQYNFQTPIPLRNQLTAPQNVNAAIMSSDHVAHSTLVPYVATCSNQQPLNTTRRAILPARLFHSTPNVKKITRCTNSTITSGLLERSSDASSDCYLALGTNDNHIESTHSTSMCQFSQVSNVSAVQNSTSPTVACPKMISTKSTKRARYKLIHPSLTSNTNRTLVAESIEVDEELSELFEEDFDNNISCDEENIVKNVNKPRIVSNILLKSTAESNLSTADNETSILFNTACTNSMPQSSIASPNAMQRESANEHVEDDFAELLTPSTDDESDADSEIDDRHIENSHEPIHQDTEESYSPIPIQAPKATKFAVGSISEMFGYKPKSLCGYPQQPMDLGEPKSRISGDVASIKLPNPLNTKATSNSVVANNPATLSANAVTDSQKLQYSTKQALSESPKSSMANPKPTNENYVIPAASEPVMERSKPTGENHEINPESTNLSNEEPTEPNVEDDMHTHAYSRAATEELIASEPIHTSVSNFNETEYRIGSNILKIYNHGTINIHFHSHPQN